MNTASISYQNKHPTLYPLLALLVLIFFSRLFVSLGVSHLFNFYHLFFFVLNILVWMVSRDKVPRECLLIFLLLFVYLVSSLINQAGVFNFALGYVLIIEPLLIYMILVGRKDYKSYCLVKYLFLIICFSNLLFSYWQYFVLDYFDDAVKGIFIGMGNGAHVGGGLSMGAFLYLISSNKNRGWVITLLLSFLFLFQIVMSDAKQIIFILFVSMLINEFFSSKKGINAMLVFSAICLLLLFLIEFVPGYSVWADFDKLYSGITQKLSVFTVLIDNFDGFYNYIFGLGPGHTITRVAWLLPEYFDNFDSIFVTKNCVTSVIFEANQNNTYSNSSTGSSLFSLYFSFAGILGDIGFLGLFLYLAFFFSVLVKQKTKTGKLLVIFVLVSGAVFAYLEEPQFMTFQMVVLYLVYMDDFYTNTRASEILPANDNY